MPGNTITVSNVFVANTKAKSGENNTNFNDLVDGLSDGTKDISIATLFTKTVSTNGAHVFTALDGIRTLISNLSATGIAVTLPTASANSGRYINIKKGNSLAGTISVNPVGAETIDNTTTFALFDRFDNLSFFSDGASWNVIGKELASSVRKGLAYETENISGQAFASAVGTSNNVQDMGTDTILIPAGDYVIDFGAQFSLTHVSAVASSAFTVVRVAEGANTLLTIAPGMPHALALQLQGAASSTQRLTVTTATTLKLTGAVIWEDGIGSATANCSKGFLTATRV